MKRYPKDPIAEALTNAQDLVKADGNVSDIDLVDLLEKSKEIIRREIHNLMKISMTGKLKVRESEALVQYTKLLSALVKEEEKRLHEDQS